MAKDSQDKTKKVTVKPPQDDDFDRLQAESLFLRFVPGGDFASFHKNVQEYKTKVSSKPAEDEKAHQKTLASIEKLLLMTSADEPTEIAKKYLEADKTTLISLSGDVDPNNGLVFACYTSRFLELFGNTEKLAELTNNEMYDAQRIAKQLFRQGSSRFRHHSSVQRLPALADCIAPVLEARYAELARKYAEENGLSDEEDFSESEEEAEFQDWVKGGEKQDKARTDKAAKRAKVVESESEDEDSDEEEE